MLSRHRARAIALQSLYEWDFRGQKGDLKKIVEKNLQEFVPETNHQDFVWRLIKAVKKNLPQLNKIIEKAAPQWPLEKIGIIDRNVLRLGLYELLHGDPREVPPKVAMDEAIELAKAFGGEKSGKFVNGVLGTVYRELKNQGIKKP